MITARHLKQILAIHEFGTFNRAALALHISQPALTASIAKLEDRMGVAFFERSRKGVSPTVFGTHIIENAQEILFRLDKLQSEISLIAAGDRGEIRVRAGPVLIHGSFRSVIPAFCRRYPNVNTRLSTGSSSRILEDVEAGRVDLGVATTFEPPRLPSVIVLPLLEDEIVFAARPAHPLVGKDRVNKSELWEYPLAVPEIPVELLPWFEVSTEDGVAPANVCLETNHYELLIRTVCESDAITGAPGHLVRPYLEQGVLSPIAYSDAALKWKAQAVFNSVSRLSPPFMALMEMLTDWSQTQSTGGLSVLA